MTAMTAMSVKITSKVRPVRCSGFFGFWSSMY